MTPYKYHVGQKVKFAGHIRAMTPVGEYEVTRLLPAEGNNIQYRLKALGATQERVAREDQLDPAAGSAEVSFFRTEV